MEIDYKVPFECQHIYHAQVQTVTGVQLVIQKCRIRMLWEDVRFVEEFVDNHTFPEYAEIDKTKIGRAIGMPYITALAPYDDVVKAWEGYRIWSSKPVNLLNKN